MFKRLMFGSAIAIAVIAGLVALYVFRPPAEASRPIEAIPIATVAPVPTAAPAATAAPVATTAPAPTEVAETVEETEAAEPAEALAVASAEEPAAASSGPRIFEIVPSRSQARFLIDEVLRGSPFTVVGVTDQVAGQIAVDPSDPRGAQVGPILVNARTLATDNGMRNRAIRNFILNTNAYEFVTFTPTSIDGLPEAVTVGQAFSFQISGDLTIKDTTRPVTFDVTVTPVSEDELVGSASTTILYRDFGLLIPDAPAVDTVADEVRLELDFVAQPTAG